MRFVKEMLVLLFVSCGACGDYASSVADAGADANCPAALRTCVCTEDGLEECGFVDIQWDCGCHDGQ